MTLVWDMDCTIFVNATESRGPCSDSPVYAELGFSQSSDVLSANNSVNINGYSANATLYNNTNITFTDLNVTSQVYAANAVFSDSSLFGYSGESGSVAFGPESPAMRTYGSTVTNSSAYSIALGIVNVTNNITIGGFDPYYQQYISS